VSDLLALSFDADASPVVRFRDPVTAGAGAARLYGWGLGWYPNSERGASVVKDPSSAGADAVGQAVGEWKRFRSTLFLCHLRGHKRPRSQQDAQPFVRSYGGRQWIFAHDGDFAPGWEERLPLPDDPAFDPLGRTDSEHAFCWLLARLHERRARSLGEVEATDVHAWLSQLNEAGPLNLLVSDGDLLAVYRDARGVGSLMWTRRVPPHAHTHLESASITVDLDDPSDTNRTAAIFSSSPLSDDEWLALEPGQLVLVRRGSAVWDSRPQPAMPVAPGAPPPPAPQAPSRVETSTQIASAQPLPVAVEPVPPTARVLRVVHETTYEYTEPVERSSHRLLLRPIEDRLQEVLSYEIEASPPGHGAAYEDVFGNEALHLELDAPYSELRVVARTRLRMHVPPSLDERLGERRLTLPLAWMPWQRQMLQAYLMPPELPESQLEELNHFGMSFVERNDYDLVGAFQDMNQTLYRDFEYVSGSTTVATTPFEVFQSRRGVCQDFANLMICMARLLQVPARYRMGYIFTGAEYGNKIQSEASHAWVELYVPRLGWHGFDPTNGREAGSEHVRVACGRDYRDATPTAGTIYRGGGMETLTIAVRVEEEVAPQPDAPPPPA
jgi:transglutaminase-like putative cysteine protease/predicted glutamine amidotransferase